MECTNQNDGRCPTMQITFALVVYLLFMLNYSIRTWNIEIMNKNVTTCMLPVLRDQNHSAGISFFDLQPNTSKSTITDSQTAPSSVPTTHSPSYKNQTLYYTEGRADRSGAVLVDLLQAHAYCFLNNYTYFGACYNNNNGGDNQRLYVQQLIEDLNLEYELKLFQPCPTDIEFHNDQQPMTSNLKRLYFIDYHNFDLSQKWTPDWMQYIHLQLDRQGKQKQLQQEEQLEVIHTENTSDTVQSNPNDDDVVNIFVLIRRGDVTLCDPSISFRYLANQHYLNLLLQIIGPDTTISNNYTVPESTGSNNDTDLSLPTFTWSTPLPNRSEQTVLLYNITIYSEKLSMEPWDIFEKQLQQLPTNANYTYHLILGSDESNESITSIWMNIINHADIFIMSKSSFSMAPALLLEISKLSDVSKQKPIIIAPTSFWYQPLPSWTRLFNTTEEQILYEQKLSSLHAQLNTTYCKYTY